MSEIEYAVIGIEPEDFDEQNESLVDDLPASIDFEVMAFGGQATVCAAAPKRGRRSTAYQSEAEIGRASCRERV